MNTYSTRTQAIVAIRDIIEAGDVTNAETEYDLDAIAEIVLVPVRKVRELEFEIVDDPDLFWSAVEQHCKA